MADTTTDKKKKKKKKGPIRTEAIIPLVVVIGLLIAYFNYFFDNHLRKAIEFGATYAHGAEVNVASLNMLWLQPGLRISGIQVTNKEKPSHNMVEVGKINLRLLWDGLLRGKFIIPESSITDIRVGTERRRPGRVLPKKTSGSDGPGMVEDAADKTIEQLKQKNEENFLSDLIAVADGGDHKAQLKKLEGELKSSAKIKTLEKELKNKEVEWKKRMDELPDDSELKKLNEKIKTFKFKSGNPKEIQASLKELDKIYKDARAKYKNVEGAKKAFNTDFKKYKGTYKSLEKMVQEDINDISKKMNLPSLDPQEITKMLLGNMVAKQLGNIDKYKNMAREYMPTKTKEERKDDRLTPVERATGRNFKFLRTKSYPKFWLQKAQISSKASEGGFSGDLDGTITDVTDSPRHLGKPTKATIKGDFPHSQIYGLLANIVVDHTGDIAKESAVITVDKFPVSRNTLTSSEDVSFGYNKALGKSKMNVNIQEGILDINTKTLFSEVDYFVDSKSASMKKILQNVTKQLNNIDLNVRAKGSWEDLKLNINSNLGKKLADAIKGQIQARIKQARADVEKHVRGLIDKEKGKLDGELAKIENKFGVSLKNKDSAIKSAEAAVKKKKDEAVNKEKKKAEDKLKKKAGKELDKLKKKFKLKF